MRSKNLLQLWESTVLHNLKYMDRGTVFLDCCLVVTIDEIKDRNDRKRLIKAVSRLNHILNFILKFVSTSENENDGEIEIEDCFTKPVEKLEI